MAKIISIELLCNLFLQLPFHSAFLWMCFYRTSHCPNTMQRDFMSVSAIADNKDCKAIYEGLISGDPKLRSYRALYQRIYGKYIIEAKNFLWMCFYRTSHCPNTMQRDMHLALVLLSVP